MKRVFILICILLTTATATAQFGRQRQNRLGRQQPNPITDENRKVSMEKKAAERQEEYIINFLSILEADDFQKEIAKLTLNDYFAKVKELVKLDFENSAQRKDTFDALKEEHFKELKSLLSAKDNYELDKLLKGEFRENEIKKKKKKKRRKKKDKDDDN
ncbi:hypothetical protein [Winogradskyella haliclonae]|uniref:Uncharacterized protein n=1 Tax=Winogradskyella haliclonae TaxID=2048558 RepID=A0ABQ2C0I3_9FLAO|nr:hypothetical protein [Winogradskyella haliclonae]GGI57553.1 hypothetical protein GCM10011444_18620 [Winogradskyella haliclonae]